MTRKVRMARALQAAAVGAGLGAVSSAADFPAEKMYRTIQAAENVYAFNLDDFRRTFAGDDYARDKAFRDFFVLSAVERAWQEAKGNLAEE